MAGEKNSGRAATINILTLLIGVLILYIIVDNFIRERETQRQNAQRQITSMVDLAADDISHALGGARESLRIISRLPSMRESHLSGKFSAGFLGKADQTARFLEALETTFDEASFALRESSRDLQTWIDFSQSAWRRAEWTLGLLPAAEPDESAAPGNALKPAITQALQFSKTLFPLGRNGLEHVIVALAPAFSLVDSAFHLGTPVPFDLVDVQRLLNNSLSDTGLIRSLSVKTLSGKTLLGATEIKENSGFPAPWDSGAAKSSRTFQPGPVYFHEGLGRPLWQAGMLIRDLERKPYAVLASQIDLGFLNELIRKSRLSPSSYMFIVDEEGIIISHPKASVVASQINASHANPAVSDVLQGNDGFREIQIGGSTYLTGFRQLRNIDKINLPGWGILYMVPASEALTGLFDVVIQIVIWCGLAFYILLNVNDLILSSLEEELEA